MHIWLLKEIRSKLGRASRVFKDVDTLYTAGLLMLQCCLALLIATTTPFIVRRIALPSSVRNEVELNLSFDTCFSELHGICSFPSATVKYEKGALFSPSVSYVLSVRLHFADIPQGQKLGIFQNVLSFYDGEELQKTYTKSSYLKEPTLITQVIWILFFPLYFCGMFHDYNFVEVPLTAAHIETYAKLSTKFVYELQDRFAQIDSAVLVIDARFGIIRHLLYNWPLTTSTVLFLFSLSACVLVIILYWGTRSLVGLSRVSEGETDVHSDPQAADMVTSGKSSLSHLVHADEYIPDNVDEVPTCSDFIDIPGWEVNSASKCASQTATLAASNSLRRRMRL